MSKTLTAPQYIDLVHIAADLSDGVGDHLEHAFCTTCFPIPRGGIQALCGARRKTDRPYRPLDDMSGDLLCVVCDDLADIRCLVCGS